MQAEQHALASAEDPSAQPPVVGAVFAVTQHGVGAAQALAASYACDAHGALEVYLRIDDLLGPAADGDARAPDVGFVDAERLLRIVAASQPPSGWSVLERSRQVLMARLSQEVLADIASAGGGA